MNLQENLIWKPSKSIINTKENNMHKNKIKILDCSLRDGGYYNNWDFDKYLVENYLKCMKDAKVDIVEIGFRSLPSNDFKGPFYYSTENFLNNLNIPKSFELAVMLNANEWIFNTEEQTIDTLKDNFCNSNLSKINMVRIAVNIKNYETSKILVKTLKKLGYKIGFNLMQSHGQSESFYFKVAKDIFSWNAVDVLYYADSLGCMEPDEIKFVSRNLLKGWKSQLGIHTHNNKNLALINTLTAISNHVTFCDSTILGMGRGAGNLPTEALITEASYKGYHHGSTQSLTKTIGDFKKLKSELHWGPNYFYHFAANNNIHPTYVQKISDDSKYTKEETYEILKKLATIKSSSFNTESLEKVVFDNEEYHSNGSWDATDWLTNKKVLIVGGGRSVDKYKDEIIDYVNENDLKVIFLNLNKFLPSKIGFATVISHQTRILFEFEKYKKLNHFIILPLARFKDQIGKELNDLEILDYGLSIKFNSFDIRPKGCKIGTSLALAYALSIVTQANAKKIFLAGFDGYPINDVRNIEINKLFTDYANLNNSIPFEAVTPTNYSIKKGSIFAPFSHTSSYAVIIPARYKSSRFPGKPLKKLNGKAVIEHVWEKCVEAVGEENVFVATDSDKIRIFCEKKSIKTLMTSRDCLTGTDRVYEASLILNKDIYINVQGDEPFINPIDIRKILNEAKKFPEKIFNGMSDISNKDDFFNYNVPKVVTNNNGKLLYMSRSPIPANKKNTLYKNAKKQICVYAFPNRALMDFGKYSSKTRNEFQEDIEILRFLDIGYEINMIDLKGSYIAIDTPEDLKKANEYIKNISN